MTWNDSKQISATISNISTSESPEHQTSGEWSDDYVANHAWLMSRVHSSSNGSNTTDSQSSFQSTAKGTFTYHTDPVPTPERTDSIQIRQHRLWQPVWLKRVTLLAFAVFFTALWIALLILWRFSLDGIQQNISQNRYAWTYGPTAILVIVVSLWRQVDFHCKTLSPWQNLRKGPRSAAQTVLLDYVSPMQTTSFCRALRFGNYSVAFSVAGFFILKLAVVFSTGLLLSRPTSLISTQAPITMTTKFDAVAYNATVDPIMQTRPPGAMPDVKNNDFYWPAYLNPIQAFSGVQQGGIDMPPGASEGLTYEIFKPADDVRNTTQLTTTVSTFVPLTSCELAEVSFNTEAITHNVTGGQSARTNPSVFTVNITTPTCHLQEESLTGCSTTCQPRTINAKRKWVSCLRKIDSRSNDTLYDANDGDYRWVLAISDLRTVQSYNSSAQVYKNLQTITWNIAAVTAVVCKIDYSMTSAPLTYNYKADGTSSVSINATAGNPPNPIQHLDGLTDTQLNQAVSQMLLAGGSSVISGIPPPKELVASDFFFNLLFTSEQPDILYEPYFDADVLRAHAESLFNKLSQYFALAFLMYPSNTRTTGTMEYFEFRLYIGTASLWLMVGCFVAMTILSLGILHVRPRHVVPRSVEGIDAMAALLQGSNKFQEVLTWLGNARQSVMKTRLQDYWFRTVVSDSFQIEAIPFREETKSLCTNKSNNQILKAQQWYPWAARYPMLALNLSIPVVIAVILEILQRISNDRTGIATIKSRVAESAYQYITSLVMLIVATLFNSLDFAIVSFAPFSALRSEGDAIRHALDPHLTGYMPPLVLWNAARTLQTGPFLSTLAGLIGSTLTIIASGLLYLDPQSFIPLAASIQRLDTWDPTLFDTTRAGGASQLLSMVNFQNSTYPAWTFDELAFPQLGHNLSDATFLGVSNSTRSHNGNVTQLQFDVPAVRGNLNCTLLASDQISARMQAPDAQSPVLLPLINLRIPMPAYCADDGDGEPSIFNTAVRYGEEDTEPEPNVYIRKMFDIKINHTSLLNPADRSAPRCPSVGFLFGRIALNSTADDNMTGLICYQEIQEVQTSTAWVQTFDGFAGTPMIQSLSPPAVDESSVKLLTNRVNGSTAFEWAITDPLQSSIQKTDDTGDDLWDAKVFHHVSPIFNLVLRKVSGGYDPEELMGPQNVPRLIRVLNHFYRQYMAQAISINMRTALSEANNATLLKSLQDIGASSIDTFTGTAYIQAPRLKMDSTIKLALQIIFGGMIVLGINAFALTAIRGTLSHNPHSIAGTMSLLAGSKLCERLPKGSEWLDDHQLKQIFNRSGWIYSLGWWDTDKVNVKGVYEKRFGVDIDYAE